MNDFFASLFEWWGVNPLYATDLGEHLRGYDLKGHYDGTPWYINIGWMMIGTTVLIFAVQYFIINSSRFNRAWHWWVMALVLFIINFGIGFTIPYNDLSSGNVNTHLHFTTADCIGFGFSTALWSLILLAAITITPLRKLSSQCRNTTFGNLDNIKKMARLYIFAIGGTGSRVLKSLTMLLASGVKANRENYEIVPIIIDPHKGNEDLKRTVRIMDNYQKIAAESKAESGFFGTKISTLDKIISSDGRLTDSFVFDILDVSNTKFRDYIDFNQLDESNQALSDLLFSGTSINKRQEKVNLLDIEMDIGFIGNPNVGSVVLDQFKDSTEFKEFANNFNDGDRIFIISSIFGGTGAAGFPTILKNIRNARNTPNLNAQGFLENAPIGAITVLPYFNLETDEKSPVQRADFISKTRSALYYYKESVNKKINALYYIGDDYSGKAYKNDPGDGGQQNDAHFVELGAAIAILDFIELPGSDLICTNGKAVNPIFKEFSILKNAESIRFSDMEAYTERKIGIHLAQMTMFKRYLDEQLSVSAGKQTWCTEAPNIDRAFMDSTFYRNTLQEFLKAYGDWLKELSENRRGFAPLNVNGSLETLLVDKKLNSGIFSKKIDNSFIDGELNKISKGKNFSSNKEKFLQLFYSATEKILIEKYGMNN